METNQKELFTKVWNSTFIRIFLCAMLCQLTMSITNTVLPLYVINGLGMSAAQSGLLGTAFTVGSLIARVIAGYVTDRFGRRVTMMCGAAIVTVSLFMLGIEATLVMLLVFKVTQGIGNSLHSTAANAAASEVLPHEHVGQGLGYYAMHTMLCDAFGPTVSLLLLGVGVAAGQQNYRLSLFVAGFAGCAVLLIELTLGYEKKLKAFDPTYGHKPTGIHISDFVDRRALVPALMMLFTSFCSGTACYMIVFATDKGYASVNYYYVIFAVVGVVTRFLLGHKLESVRPRTVAVCAIALDVLAYLALGFTESEWAFLLSAVCLGAFESILTPTFNAMAMKLAPQSRAGAAASTYWLGMDFGICIGMVACGAVIDAGGYGAAFLFSGCFMLVFGIVAFFLLRKAVPLTQMVNPEDD